MTRLASGLFPYDPRSLQLAVGIATTVTIGVVITLGWMTSVKLKEVAVDDFNAQQLVLAQHTARQIENSLKILGKELRLLSLSPSIQYFEAVSLGKRMGITFSSISEEGALEIRYVESKTRLHVYDSRGYRSSVPGPDDAEYLDWGRDKENRSRVLMSEVAPSADGSGVLLMRMAMPVWQVSVDDSYPVASNEFSGVLIFVVDATSLVGEIADGIRSGKTGYAWAIDGKGMFLFHPAKDFIGKNAFTAREEKKPTISFDRINQIQRDKMLAGLNGTSWYVSGWHRGEEGEMKKLIAYAATKLDDSEERLWSVAVVAPMREVEDTIRSVHIRQFTLQAVIIVFILSGNLVIIFLMINWSTTLKEEVEKKAAEMKRSEERYKSLVESAEDIIFSVDADGVFLSVNRYGAKFFEKSPDGILGRGVSDVLLPPDAEALLAKIREVFNTGQSSQITHKVNMGEHEYWLNTNLRGLFDEEGNIYAVLGISRDVTQRKKMEEASYHTEKLVSLGTLSAGVAHEINNPLGIILGFADLLLERTNADSEEHGLLKRIEAQGLKAKRVVENLLSFSRYTEYREEAVDVNRCVATVLSVAENTMLLNKVDARLDLQSDLPTVKGYAEEIQQVFFNIVTNAVQAMKGGGTLSVSTRARDGRVEIRFSDTGHGIRKEHRPKVFDPLFTTKKVGEGTGLGLSVSYGIVTKHGGTIDIETRTSDESETPGTTVLITLQIDEAVGSEAEVEGRAGVSQE